MSTKFFMTDHVQERAIKRDITHNIIKRALVEGQFVQVAKHTYKVVTPFCFLVISFCSNQKKSCRIHTAYVPTDYQIKLYYKVAK